MRREICISWMCSKLTTEEVGSQLAGHGNPRDLQPAETESRSRNARTSRDYDIPGENITRRPRFRASLLPRRVTRLYARFPHKSKSSRLNGTTLSSARHESKRPRGTERDGAGRDDEDERGGEKGRREQRRITRVHLSREH